MKTFLCIALGLSASTILEAGEPLSITPPVKKDSKSATNQQVLASGAVLVDWPFLDRANSAVSDGPIDGSIDFPSEIRALDNKRIAIVGFMAPWEQIDDMTKFILVPAYVGCFFCSPPAATQVALVQQTNPKGKKLPFINDAVLVTGTLRLFSPKSTHPAHQAAFVYALDDAVAEVYNGKDKPVRAPGDLPADPKRKPKVY